MATEALGEETKQQIRDAFKKADINQDGFISQEELKNCFRSLGEWDEEELTILFGATDVNEDGKLCYDEFLDWVLQSGAADQVVSCVSDVRVVDMAGNDCGTFTLSLDEYIMDLKKRLSNFEHIHSKQLVFDGNVLKESSNVRECSIPSGAILTLVTKDWPEALEPQFRTPTIDAGFRTTVRCTNATCPSAKESGVGWTEGELRSESKSKAWLDGEVEKMCISWFVCLQCGEIGDVTGHDAGCTNSLNPFAGVYQTASVPSKRKEIYCWWNVNDIIGGGPQDEELDANDDIVIEGLVTDVGPGKLQEIFIRKNKYEQFGSEKEDDGSKKTQISETKGTWTGRGIFWDDGSFWEWVEPTPGFGDEF